MMMDIECRSNRKSIVKKRIKWWVPVCAVLLCQLFPQPGFAIVNVEQAIIGRPTDGVHTTMGLNVSGASGNTDKSATGLDWLTLVKRGNQSDYLQLQYAYGKSRGQVDTDNAFAHLRHRTDVTDNWGVEAFAQIGRDRFARMTRRTLLGGGVRRVLYEEDQKSAGYLGLGAFHEHEILSEVPGTTDPLDTSLWRANSYLILKKKFNENVRLYSTTYYQPQIARADNFRALEQASALVKVGENLDLRLSLNISFVSKPPQSVQKRDVLYGTGLEMNF